MLQTVSDLLDNVYRRGFIPDSQGTFTEAEILTIASEELRSLIQPEILNSNEEYYVYHKDINIVELQPKFLLQPSFKYEWKTIREINYVADFKIEVFWDYYIVDSKWFETADFKIKKKMFLFKHWNENILIVCKSIKEIEKILFN